jgi:hypothetical protein
MILQQQPPQFFNGAVHLKLRGATTPGVILNLFLPFMKPSKPAITYCFISIGCTHHFNSFAVLLALKQTLSPFIPYLTSQQNGSAAQH